MKGKNGNSDRLSLGSKITADGDCGHELKDACSWKKSNDEPRRHKKQRHYFADKDPYSQSCGFSSSHLVMWELDHKEGWAPKNWCFWTVVLEKILRVPWTARRSNQSILKEINPEYSLEALILKLKLQYFGHLMGRANSLEKTLMLGMISARRRGRQRMRWLDAITDSWTWIWTSSRRWRTGMPGVLQGHKVLDMTVRLNNKLGTTQK